MPVLLQLTLLFLVILLVVPLAEKLKIPQTFGYLLAGICLSPFIQLPITDIAILSLMFVLGLSLNSSSLRVIKTTFLKFELSQFLFTATLITGLTWLFSHNLVVGFILGVSLAFSSQTIVIPLLHQSQKLGSPLGQKTYSVLIAQTVLSIMLFVIIPILSDTHSIQYGVAYFASIIAALTGLHLFNEYVLARITQYLICAKQNSFIVFIPIVSILCAALILNTFSIAPPLAALITGILIAHCKFKQHIEPCLKTLKPIFIGFFFVGIGLILNFKTLIDSAAFIIFCTIALIIIKFSAVFAWAYFSKINLKNSLSLSVLLAQASELTFVFLYLAQNESLITTTLVQQIEFIILLSMALTPISYWLFKTYFLPKIELSIPQEYEQNSTCHNTLMIAGFSEFGQTIARLASIQNIPFTVLDHKAIEHKTIAPYGGQAYIIDITQPKDLLAAGIEHVKTFVVTIDDIEDSLNAVRYVSLNYPHIEIFVCANNRYHAQILQDLGIQHIWRKDYLASLSMSYHILKSLGVDAQYAHEQIKDFRIFDENLLMHTHHLEQSQTDLAYLLEQDQALRPPKGS